ncbi:hypothetical protein [Oryzifoliimicrobium ureilyticus]|uniref:hypothetical protein n=1 Tax=Oryzifoliimicrobium ureilyticus TaxID=3113724 RepID=UPI003075F76B
MSGLFSRLKDFSTPELPPAPALPVFEDDFPVFSDPPPPSIDLEAEREEAYQRGRADAIAEVTQRFEDEIQTRSILHEREVDELRRRYEEEFAASIKESLQKLAPQIAQLVSEKTAEAIVPLFNEIVVEKAIKALAALLQETIGEGGAAAVVVQGPASLFALLKAQLGEGAQILRHHETDDMDLTVEIDDGLLVTRLSAWAAGLGKVME